MKSILKTLMVGFLTTSLYGGCADIANSLIISPSLNATVGTSTPVIIGLMRNDKNRPLKRKSVSIYLDGRLIAKAETNEEGIWSYTLRKDQALCNGFHFLHASACLTLNSTFWSQPAIFYVHTTPVPTQTGDSKVNAANSNLIFPFDLHSLNNTKTIIIGSLVDAHGSPVAGETVIIQLDNMIVSTTTSDHNGIFYYVPSIALGQGSHTVAAYCVESEVSLTPRSFVIDTHTPYPPVIVTPQENSIVTDRRLFVSGTSESAARITTFLDNDIYGALTYSDEQGNWNILYEVEDGNHSIRAQATDVAGNSSPLTPIRSFYAQEIIS